MPKTVYTDRDGTIKGLLVEGNVNPDDNSRYNLFCSMGLPGEKVEGRVGRDLNNRPIAIDLGGIARSLCESCEPGCEIVLGQNLRDAQALVDDFDATFGDRPPEFKVSIRLIPIPLREINPNITLTPRPPQTDG